MSEAKDFSEVDRAIDESLRRSFSPPGQKELAGMSAGAMGSGVPPVRSGRRTIWVALAAAAALVLLLRLGLESGGVDQRDPALTEAWLERWEEISVSPAELGVCTVVAEAPTGLLLAARSQLGLHLESEALSGAFAPTDRVQRLDDVQGVQLVIGDHAYLFFALTEGNGPDGRGIEEAGLRMTMRAFDEVRVYEIAGEAAPEVLSTLRVVGRDPR